VVDVVTTNPNVYVDSGTVAVIGSSGQVVERRTYSGGRVTNRTGSADTPELKAEREKQRLEQEKAVVRRAGYSSKREQQKIAQIEQKLRSAPYLNPYDKEKQSFEYEWYLATGKKPTKEVVREAKDLGYKELKDYVSWKEKQEDFAREFGQRWEKDIYPQIEEKIYTKKDIPFTDLKIKTREPTKEEIEKTGLGVSSMFPQRTEIVSIERKEPLTVSTKQPESIFLPTGLTKLGQEYFSVKPSKEYLEEQERLRYVEIGKKERERVTPFVSAVGTATFPMIETRLTRRKDTPTFEPYKFFDAKKFEEKKEVYVSPLGYQLSREEIELEALGRTTEFLQTPDTILGKTGRVIEFGTGQSVAGVFATGILTTAGIGAISKVPTITKIGEIGVKGIKVSTIAKGGLIAGGTTLVGKEIYDITKAPTPEARTVGALRLGTFFAGGIIPEIPTLLRATKPRVSTQATRIRNIKYEPIKSEFKTIEIEKFGIGTKQKFSLFGTAQDKYLVYIKGAGESVTIPKEQILSQLQAKRIKQTIKGEMLFKEVFRGRSLSTKELGILYDKKVSDISLGMGELKIKVFKAQIKPRSIKMALESERFPSTLLVGERMKRPSKEIFTGMADVGTIFFSGEKKIPYSQLTETLGKTKMDLGKIKISEFFGKSSLLLRKEGSRTISRTFVGFQEPKILQTMKTDIGDFYQIVSKGVSKARARVSSQVSLIKSEGVLWRIPKPEVIEPIKPIGFKLQKPVKTSVKWLEPTTKISDVGGRETAIQTTPISQKPVKTSVKWLEPTTKISEMGVRELKLPTTSTEAFTSVLPREFVIFGEKQKLSPFEILGFPSITLTGQDRKEKEREDSFIREGVKTINLPKIDIVSKDITKTLFGVYPMASSKVLTKTATEPLQETIVSTPTAPSTITPTPEIRVTPEKATITPPFTIQLPEEKKIKKKKKRLKKKTKEKKLKKRDVIIPLPDPLSILRTEATTFKPARALAPTPKVKRAYLKSFLRFPTFEMASGMFKRKKKRS